MRSCGNFVVIWFHCKFLHSWMVNFQEGIYWTDRAFNSAWANTLPFCLVTKLAKEKEKEKNHNYFKFFANSDTMENVHVKFSPLLNLEALFFRSKKIIEYAPSLFLFFLLKNEFLMYCCCLYTNVLCWDTRASNFVRYNAVRSMYKLISC